MQRPNILPLSAACENNKDPILIALKALFTNYTSILEIGGGTGQHAIHFAKNLPHLNWQTTDFGKYLPSLLIRVNDANQPNLPQPLELDVRTPTLPTSNFDAIFSANTLHIMSSLAVKHFFKLAGKILSATGLLVVYGPFNYEGKYSSLSNEQFDLWLRTQNTESAIRDFEWLDSLASKQGFEFQQNLRMPANNHMLVWQKG